MFYYRLTHFFITRQPEHFHWFDIGIYKSKEKAQAALEQLKTQPGFCLRPKAFRIRRVFRFREPQGLNSTCWAEGFETYTYKPHAQPKVHKKGRDDSSPGRYFITFCTDEHEPLLWDEAATAGFPPLSQIGCVVAQVIPLIHDNFREGQGDGSLVPFSQILVATIFLEIPVNRLIWRTESPLSCSLCIYTSLFALSSC